jgi:hypothetical protein
MLRIRTMRQDNRLAASGSVRHHTGVTDWQFQGDDGVPSPEMVAVWARLDMLAPEKVPLWAAHWLVAGYDGEHVVHLAGLPGDDSREIRDILPDALRDCGVALPESDVAAATVVFVHLARMHVDGLAGAVWVIQKVDEVVMKSGYAERVRALPLGRLFDITERWGADWEQPGNRLAEVVRDACEEQLHDGSVAT